MFSPGTSGVFTWTHSPYSPLCFPTVLSDAPLSPLFPHPAFRRPTLPSVGHFCFIYEIAWQLSHNFHCRLRIDGGAWIKCVCCLMSAQTCLVYTPRQRFRFCCLVVMWHSSGYTPCLLKVQTGFVISMRLFINKFWHEGWNQFQSGMAKPLSLVWWKFTGTPGIDLM